MPALSSPRPSRRAVLAALALAPLAGPAFAYPGSFSSVTVDVSELKAKGLGPTADILGRVALAQARAAFADRTGPGPTLVIRLTNLSFRPNGGGAGAQAGSAPNDYLEGELVVVGPRGAVIERRPQLFAQPSSYGGAWYDPESERRRLTALASNFALWARRQI
jgi:hypothetical protein